MANLYGNHTNSNYLPVDEARLASRVVAHDHDLKTWDTLFQITRTALHADAAGHGGSCTVLPCPLPCCMAHLSERTVIFFLGFLKGKLRSGQAREHPVRARLHPDPIGQTFLSQGPVDLAWSESP